MKCVSLINRFDYLSHEVKLTINQKETRLKTLCGGMLSILSVVMMSAFCLFFFIKLIQKDNTYVTISSESSYNSSIFDSNNYPFLIRLTDKENKPFSNPDQIFKIYLKYWYGGSNSLENVKQKTVDIKMEPCDLNKNFGNYRDKFEDITDLSTFYCAIPRSENETIFGRYGNIYPFGYYHFYVTMCIDSPDCLDFKEIKKITENVYLDFRTVDYTIDNMKEEAKVEIVRTDRHMISSTVYKRIWLYLNSIKYTTDTGLFFNTQSTEYFSQFDSMRYDIDLRDILGGTIPGTFVTLTVLNTGNTMIYDRKYLKLQEYLASIGGIAKFIQIAAFILNYTFSQNTYFVKLINDLQVVYPNKQQKNNSPFRYSNSFCNNMIDISVEPHIEMNNSEDCINKTQLKKKDVLDDRLYKWYYRLIPMQLRTLNKKERNLLNKCIEAINLKMNIVNMITKIEYSHLFLQRYINEQQNNFNIFKYNNKKMFDQVVLNKSKKAKTILNFGNISKKPICYRQEKIFKKEE